MRVLLNIAFAVIFLIAFVSAVWAGVHNGNLWGTVIVFIAWAIYILIDWPSRKRSSTAALQYGMIRALSGLLFFGLGAFSIWRGFSEFSSPVTFSYPLINDVAWAIRKALGSISISMLLWGLGAALLTIGIRLLSFAPQAQKLTAATLNPNPTAKRDTL